MISLKNFFIRSGDLVVAYKLCQVRLCVTGLSILRISQSVFFPNFLLEITGSQLIIKDRANFWGENSQKIFFFNFLKNYIIMFASYDLN